MRPPESRSPELPVKSPVIAPRLREKLLGSRQAGCWAQLPDKSLKQGVLIAARQPDRFATEAKHPTGGEVGQWFIAQL